MRLVNAPVYFALLASIYMTRCEEQMHVPFLQTLCGRLFQWQILP